MDTLNFAQRRKLLVMPILILPFITFAFWALGGGKGVSKHSSSSTGLNLELPEAQPKNEKNDSKLSFYEEAERDSATLRDAMKKDPYFQSISKGGNIVIESDSSFDDQMDSHDVLRVEDVNEEKVYAKIRELNQHLKERSSIQTAPVEMLPRTQQQNEAGTPEQLVQINPKYDKDSEMIALNGLMDKIIAIQHPGQLEAKEGKGPKNEEKVFKVTGYDSGEDQSYFGSIKQRESDSSFYGFGDTPDVGKGNLIAAQADQDQKLYSGSILKMRLLQDMYVGNEKVPKGSFIYGGISIEENRLKVAISSIRVGQLIFPVHITVYDFDGQPGINIPGGSKSTSIKQASETGLQGVDLGSLDPSLKAQATTAGIHAVKSWINQKKEQKVFVKDGYHLFLNVKN